MSFPTARLAERFHESPLRILFGIPQFEIVVEVMGGLAPGLRLCESAASRTGKSVVTSNKELVAAKGAELLRIAQRSAM